MVRESTSIPDCNQKKRNMNIKTEIISALRRKEWIEWIENSILLLIITLAFYSLIPLHTPQLSLEKKFSITRLDTAGDIITRLNKRGYDVGCIDRFFLIFLYDAPKEDSEITLSNKRTNRLDFLYQLTQIQLKKISLFKITLIPGETKELFFSLVSKKIEVDTSKLLIAYNDLAKYPEAAIAADTYLVPKQINEVKLIKFLLGSSERAYKKLATKYFSSYEQSQWHRILIIASIIQKEAANNKEMPLIASVIYNRLKKDMRLQMDGTLNYGKYSHQKVTPKRIKNDTSHFNTYKHKGLPDSAIGSVSKQAIEAAISPAKSKYLYFMRNSKGTHDFTDTYRKHRKNIQKAK